MSKTIFTCPTCSKQLRIPGDKNIRFSCPNCHEQLSFNPNHLVDAENVTSEGEDFKPSNLRIFFHVLIGGFIGAPVGTALVGSIAGLLGSIKGYYFGFGETLQPFELISILMKSLDVIGQGAADLAVEWIPYGAKFGPIVIGVLAFFVSHSKWENSEDNKTDANSTEDR